MTRRLILRDWEAEAWHAGRLSAVVRLCPKANFDPAGNLSPADAVQLDGTGQGWVAWWGGAPKPETTARIFYPTGGFRCPLGPPGQRLWIAETWGTAFVDGIGLHTVYKADGDEQDMGYMEDGRWKSPATMPQCESRSTAVHLGSRIVRVRDLPADDAINVMNDHGQAAWDADVWCWLHRIGRE